ncbi:hypothetical protein COOONC_23276 [Cooperia oncophora]
MTNPNETLIIVTADHGHALTLPGYSPTKETLFESSKVEHREENTVKEATNLGSLQMFFALQDGFRNGFGDHSSTDIEQPFYRQPTAVRTQFGYHGGEDVGIWADGPFSELFSSSLENTEVAYIVKFLLCLSTTDFTICDIPSKSEVLSRDSRDPARLNALEKVVGGWIQSPLAVVTGSPVKKTADEPDGTPNGYSAFEDNAFLYYGWGQV